MRSILTVVLCAAGLCAQNAGAQSANIEPLHVTAGTVLTFYLQTRLAPDSGNALDALPRGTLLRVKLLNSVDSSMDPDGAEFCGTLAAPVIAGSDQVIVHSGAEVRGLLALLRSRNHPEGFRYELLVTSLTEKGKSYGLTASLNPSFSDGSKPRTMAADPSNRGTGKILSEGNAKP